MKAMTRRRSEEPRARRMYAVGRREPRGKLVVLTERDRPKPAPRPVLSLDTYRARRGRS